MGLVPCCVQASVEPLYEMVDAAKVDSDSEYLGCDKPPEALAAFATARVILTGKTVKDWPADVAAQHQLLT